MFNPIRSIFQGFDLDLLKFWKRRGQDRVRVDGFFDWWTEGPAGERVNPQRFKNGATYVGVNYILEVMFRSGSQLATWYVGLINNSAFSAVSISDTMSSHAGWTEWTSYSGSNRATWAPIAAASGVMTNTTVFTYTISATGTLAGSFLASGQANSPGTAGTLWATALQSRSITNGDTLSGNYTITLTPSS